MRYWFALQLGRPGARKRIAVMLMGAASLILISGFARAAQVSFRWDYTASGAAGFILYCGPAGGAFTTVVDVGNTDASTLAGLAQDTVYRCAVTAYDAMRSQSDYSNAVGLYVSHSGRCVTGCSGDLNHDGVVDARDLDLMKRMWGTSDPDADINGDGIVNVLDLGILRTLLQ